ncbi:hypothetical protein PoB_002695000 [Plakobranchus ocellatus]|uniref:Uncharacterized protein n=1 Tax=Plakobranchus ocellatus TaxID=259542 RepID=A0AAV3ZX58_9GAST|nr:hypothetical protein PoB_002695000 [Plakobranchus ocellatus]
MLSLPHTCPVVTNSDTLETTTGFDSFPPVVDKAGIGKGSNCGDSTQPGGIDSVNNAAGGLYRESNSRTAAVKSVETSTCSGISKGWVAGIVISVGCVCSLLVVAAVVIIKRRGLLWQHKNNLDSTETSENNFGFDNALYKAKQQDEENSDSNI